MNLFIGDDIYIYIYIYIYNFDPDRFKPLAIIKQYLLHDCLHLKMKSYKNATVLASCVNETWTLEFNDLNIRLCTCF